jgi:hypothetical protein
LGGTFVIKISRYNSGRSGDFSVSRIGDGGDGVLLFFGDGVGVGGLLFLGDGEGVGVLDLERTVFLVIVFRFFVAFVIFDIVLFDIVFRFVVAIFFVVFVDVPIYIIIG